MVKMVFVRGSKYFPVQMEQLACLRKKVWRTAQGSVVLTIKMPLKVSKYEDVPLGYFEITIFKFLFYVDLP